MAAEGLTLAGIRRILVLEAEVADLRRQLREHQSAPTSSTDGRAPGGPAPALTVRPALAVQAPAAGAGEQRRHVSQHERRPGHVRDDRCLHAAGRPSLEAEQCSHERAGDGQRRIAGRGGHRGVGRGGLGDRMAATDGGVQRPPEEELLGDPVGAGGQHDERGRSLAGEPHDPDDGSVEQRHAPGHQSAAVEDAERADADGDRHQRSVGAACRRGVLASTPDATVPRRSRSFPMWPPR